MARIDFAFGAPHRLRTACEVVHKHYLAGRRMVVYTRDVQRLAYFDRLLWGFDSAAFVPHVNSDDPLAPHTPIVLTASQPSRLASNGDDVWLLNLDMDCPPEATAFGRILEIVSNHDQDRAAARIRWRDYQAEGHELHAHDLSKTNK